MEKEFKCKTEGCSENVSLVLKRGVGTFLTNNLERNIMMHNNKMQIQAIALLDNDRSSQKLTFESETNSSLTLNVRKGYTAEALLKCPVGHEDYYTIEVI